MRTPIFCLLLSAAAVACDDADVSSGAVHDAAIDEMDGTTADAALPDATPDAETDTSAPDGVAPADAAPVADAAVPPDACVPDDEVCNGRDDDCDGVTDEALVDRPCW
ncbi:MAG: hypothetical protein KC583_15350, partial [Myxococcales bacterium]|nr:hypothetical protein [Myxococcales bacterium]